MAKRERQGRQSEQPTGTSGRQSGDTNGGANDNNDASRGQTPPSNRNRSNFDEDDDSLLGNRTFTR
jgi:hypothetical protein